MNNSILKISGIMGVLFSFCQVTSYAQVQEEPPKLVVGIVLDQMRWDYLHRFAHHYGSGGFKRLMDHGFSCERTYIPYLPTYTAPGHASVYTGSVPAIHGIVANDWVERKTQQKMYCTEDKTVKSVGGSEVAGMMSPKNMITSTLADEMKLASNERSKSFGVAIKDRGSILPAGHMANAAYWYDNKTGHFITSSFYRAELPQWLIDFNERKVGDSLMSLNWDLLKSKNQYTMSTSDDAPYEGVFDWAEQSVFPYKTSKAVQNNDYSAIQSTPYGNTIVTLLAKSLIQHESLGKDDHTDFLAISYSSTDYMGHFFGINALEIEDAYIRMDQELTALFDYLDQQVGEGEYLVFLTADHGGAHNAQFLTDRKVPAHAMFVNEWVKGLNEHLMDEFDQENLVTSLMNYQVHFNESLMAGLDRSQIKHAVIQWLEAQDGITICMDLEGDLMFKGIYILKERSQNAYYPKRSGSIQVILNPGWYSAFAPTGTTHGGWHPYDAHIPLLFYGKNIPKGKTYKNYYMTDIAPTLAAILKIQEPNGSIGEVITELLIQ